MNRLVVALAACALLPGVAQAQDNARVNWLTMHSPSIEGNLEGNPAERGVYVVTPPGYDEHADKRYPVVYFLHGYWVEPPAYEELFDLGSAVDQASAEGNEVIFVLPSGYSKHRGSFYSNSPTTGNYEGFIGEDLVAWVDANFRTLARRESRGLAGHSMGGYGATRIGMKYSDTFAALYIMSAGGNLGTLTIEEAQQAAADDGTVPEDAQFGGVQGILSRFAAWSPDPNNPPNYIYAGLLEDGSFDPLVEARFAANSTLVLLPQYVDALKSYNAIKLDCGDQDGLLAGNRMFVAELDRFGIPHEWEIYNGGHGDKVSPRLRNDVLPFFGRNLER
jgi:enterochelin esterase-like enzyme